MLSIVIIVKNDAENLNECLKSIEQLEYEIVVVDTGSTDNTKEVAFQYTEKVFDFEWCDDFSAARNFAIHQASEEFIMVLDSDESLIKIDKMELEHLLIQFPNSIGRVHHKDNYMNNGEEFSSDGLLNRIFPKRFYHYEGRIHEQIVLTDKCDYGVYVAPVFVNHNGYMGSKEKKEKKAQRNISLLKKALEIKGADPYLYYQLGKAYYYKSDYKEAVNYFSQALYFDLDTKLEYVIDMVEIYGYSLINSKQYAEALLLESVYEEFCQSGDFVYMMGLVYLHNMMFDRAILMFEKVVSYKTCKVEGVNSYLAFYNIGVIYECLDDKRKAAIYYNKCGDYKKAIEAAERLLK